MNKTLCLLSLCIVMSGCSTLPDSSATPTENLATAGSLTCKANELCPNVFVEWDKQHKEQLRVETVLNSSYDYYDIKGISFLIDDKTFAYKPVGPTQQKNINRLIPRRSSNSFILPSTFLYELKKAQNVELSIETDKGNIKRSVYTPSQQSMLYHNFVKLITTLPVQQSKS
ncbi:hypothetical protein MMP66_17505 [Acinetobacter dispersus]|uniref:hypothetical protein n=1 Tax=Acinetobacter dispersus TaxID=70348 RepID=UPI0002CE93D4|nr:hypothetical protein [Acinetobacter dispersus]ENX52920.1 hypothetical protein F901_02653 [Acinetobacter dispersus]MCH7396045.1 hypothetical protein [Acinetobacter dispersus]